MLITRLWYISWLQSFRTHFDSLKCVDDLWVYQGFIMPLNHQAVNKKAHSTETLNILLTDKILEAMDKKQITALVLLDLSKAFDSIDHARLLHKLSNIGASPSSIKWFKSYLSGRRQYVRIGSAHSKTLPIMHGVPQGAILSPLLFCIILMIYP